LLHEDRLSRVKILGSTRYEKPYCLRERHYSGADIRKRSAGSASRNDDIHALDDIVVDDAIDNAKHHAVDNNNDTFDINADFEPLHATAQYNDAGHDA
jgi:hypothetical protein